MTLLQNLSQLYYSILCYIVPGTESRECNLSDDTKLDWLHQTWKAPFLNNPKSIQTMMEAYEP